MNNANTKRQNNRFAFFLFSTLLMFFYIYQSNLSFIGIPAQFHTTRITCVLFIIWAIIKRKSAVKTNNLSIFSHKYIRKNIWFFVMLLVYAIFLLYIWGFGAGVNIFVQVINIFLFGFSALWAWSFIFSSFEELMKVLLYVGICQALVISLCLASPTVSLMIDSTLNLSELYTTFDNIIRRENYAGGIGCIAAPGLIKYSTCFVSAIYLYSKTDKIFYFIAFLFLGFIGTMIARTGIVMLFISFVFLFINKIRSRNIWIFSLIMLSSFFVVKEVVSSGKYNDFLGDRYKRYISLQDDKGEQFLSSYFKGEETEIPPLNEITIWGGGILSGRSGNGYVTNVDGGFLRLYGAIGLFGVILFYLVNFTYMSKAIRGVVEKKVRSACWLLFLILIVGETKENVFIMTWSIPLFYNLIISAYKEQLHN